MDERYDVVVIGGGAAGLSGALTLARARRSVLVVDAGEPRNAPAGNVHNYLGREGTPPAELVAIGRGEVAALEGSAAVRLTSGEVIERDAVVVAPMFSANADLLAGLGATPVPLEMNGTVMGTHLLTDPTGRTDVPGVWVAGNAGDLSAQVIVAAAQGLRAGAMINADLTTEDTGRAVAERRSVAA
ncbi:FAD-dependent oxidoreductase [Blastococcus capsensis]|uniref:FAD-dependent oxidoreductase n=1 Tax=Blastococcus capsensis TaxID=1564163 RepID=UPI002541A6DE|nr:FAD-dependent oxidoreductase [Blastococcus capsensis]MDK3258027.1 FAD-dependent oxidoreductase [Blastococcus capsensis]